VPSKLAIVEGFSLKKVSIKPAFSSSDNLLFIISLVVFKNAYSFPLSI
jgi:hypothetical protein